MTYRGFLGFLAELLLSECDDRARRRSERRIKAAGFPREKSIRQFDFDANPVIDPAAIHTLAKCDWVKKGLPLCLIGDSGTGKSHLLIALGTEAAMHEYRVKYVLATSSSTSWWRRQTRSCRPRPSPATAPTVWPPPAPAPNRRPPRSPRAEDDGAVLRGRARRRPSPGFYLPGSTERSSVESLLLLSSAVKCLYRSTG